MVQLATRIHEDACGVSAVGGNREFAIRSHGHNAVVGRRTALDRVTISAGHTDENHGGEDDRRDDDHEHHAENERCNGAASTGQLRHDHRSGSTVALRSCGTRVGSTVRGHRARLARGTVGGVRHVCAFLMKILLDRE